MELDFKVHLRPGTATHECPRLGARRASRPAVPWLVARATVGRIAAMVDFIGRLAAQPCVRAMRVVPVVDRIEFLLKCLLSVGYQKQARQEALHRENELLDHGDRAVFSHGPVARRLDALAFAPVPKTLAVELRPSVANDVLGRCVRLGKPAPATTMDNVEEAKSLYPNVAGLYLPDAISKTLSLGGGTKNMSRTTQPDLRLGSSLTAIPPMTTTRNCTTQ